MATGREKAHLTGSGAAVVFSPDSRTLAVGCDGTVIQWDLDKLVAKPAP